MKYFKQLKTSEKISAMFSLFNLFSLFVLLFSINIIYFYIWYTGIQAQSMYDMNVNYNSYNEGMNKSNKKAFVDYILQKDTIFFPHNSPHEICSKWVAEKIHNDKKTLEKIKKSFFYKIEDKIYFIFSTEYKWIWKVKILYDTTAYFNSQIIIIKVSLIIILIFLILNYIFWKYISRFILKDLKTIAKYAEDINLWEQLPKIQIDWPECDEIKILANTLEKAFAKINSQWENQKQFIVDVSHEFKTPLMIINSKVDLYSKMLDKNKASWEDLINLLSSIKLNTQKLNKLLETLFFISRIEDGVLSDNREKIYLFDFISELWNDIISSSCKEKKVDLNINIDKEVYLFGNISSFNIVIENLLTNAIKFWKRRVTIDIKYYNNILSISDDGPWIPQDKLESIWQKFSRFDTKIEGFWIGLFLVKRISKLYNWNIRVESIEGEWTTFFIEFT